LKQQDDGKILVAGNFREMNGISRNGLARLLPNGDLDVSFVPPMFAVSRSPESATAITEVIPEPDGTIWVAGLFDTVDSQPRSGIARLNTNGGLDASFVPRHSSLSPLEQIGAKMVLQPNGKVLFGYSTLNSFNPDGTLDGVISGLPGSVRALAIQPDGKILIGTTGSNAISRLFPDGNVDLSFKPPAIFPASIGFRGLDTLAVESAGGIFMAGGFDLVNGVPRPAVARLQSDGSLDTNFVVSLNKNFSSLTISKQGEDLLLLGGAFDSVNEISRPGIVRLHAGQPQEIIRPTLSYSIEDAFLAFQWPRHHEGFTLETAASLISPTWMPINSLGNSAKIPIASSHMFFRLRK
jgi:uncharacterized delta-60 repeat protein